MGAGVHGFHANQTLCVESYVYVYIIQIHCIVRII